MGKMTWLTPKLHVGDAVEPYGRHVDTSMLTPQLHVGDTTKPCGWHADPSRPTPKLHVDDLVEPHGRHAKLLRLTPQLHMGNAMEQRADTPTSQGWHLSSTWVTWQSHESNTPNPRGRHLNSMWAMQWNNVPTHQPLEVDTSASRGRHDEATWPDPCFVGGNKPMTNGFHMACPPTTALPCLGTVGHPHCPIHTTCTEVNQFRTVQIRGSYTRDQHPSDPHMSRSDSIPDSVGIRDSYARDRHSTPAWTVHHL